MTSTLKDLLLIQGFNISNLVASYKTFFLSILPTIFLMACIVEYFDRLNYEGLVKRALLAILILIGTTSFYKKSIDYSFQVADSKLKLQKESNILLMDFLSGAKKWSKLESDDSKHHFYKNKNALTGTLSFLKYHLFSTLFNDGFTISLYFITQLCLLIVKVVYSLTYYLGFGLVGIPCLIYLFPTMGNVLRGGILTYLTSIVTPHVLVFILTLIGSEINSGYQQGTIIGSSLTGSALLFLMTLFIAFTPLITIFILNGSGVSQAGAIVATLGANQVLSIPRTGINSMTNLLATGQAGKYGSIAGQVMKSTHGKITNSFGRGGSNNLSKLNTAGSKSTSNSSLDSSSFANANSNATKDYMNRSQANTQTNSHQNGYGRSENISKDKNSMSENSLRQNTQRQSVYRANSGNKVKNNNSINNNRRNTNGILSERGRRDRPNTNKTSRFNKR